MPGCRSDSDCPSHLACFQRKCVSPCNCGTNAICEAENHRAVCKCPLGFYGNAAVKCEGIVKMQTNSLNNIFSVHPYYSVLKRLRF